MKDTISPNKKLSYLRLEWFLILLRVFLIFTSNMKKSIRLESVIRSSRKGDDGQLKFVTMCCSRYGKPRLNSANAFKMPPLKGIDCKEKLGASIWHDRKWQVCFIIFDHNHELTTLEKTRFLKTNIILKTYVKRKLELNDRVGIRMNKSFNSLAVRSRTGEFIYFKERP